MARKRYKPEQIVRLLRQADVLSSQGRSVAEICWEYLRGEHVEYLDKHVRCSVITHKAHGKKKFCGLIQFDWLVITAGMVIGVLQPFYGLRAGG